MCAPQTLVLGTLHSQYSSTKITVTGPTCGLSSPLSGALSSKSGRAAVGGASSAQRRGSTLKGRQSCLWLISWAEPSSSCAPIHPGACLTEIFALQRPQMWRERRSMQYRGRRIKAIGEPIVHHHHIPSCIRISSQTMSNNQQSRTTQNQQRQVQGGSQRQQQQT